MNDKLLRPDGVVVRRPDPITRAQIEGLKGWAAGHGYLCTACLVGDWPHSMFRRTQTLCSACMALDTEVARRAGLDSGTTAGRPVHGWVVRIGADDASDPAWEPIRRARDYRAARLASVFVRARALGLVRLEERRPPAPPVELVPWSAVRRHDLIPAETEDVVRRFATWMQALDPDGHRARAAVLADVDGLATWLRVHEHEAARDRALQRLERATRVAGAAAREASEAAADLARLTRRPG